MRKPRSQSSDGHGDGRFHAFVSHNSKEKAEVTAYVEGLISTQPRLRLWVDENEIRLGKGTASELFDAIDRSRFLLVIIGPAGLGPYQLEELNYGIQRQIDSRDSFRIIPIFLPNASGPRWLRAFVGVDLSSATGDGAVEVAAALLGTSNSGLGEFDTTQESFEIDQVKASWSDWNALVAELLELGRFDSNARALSTHVQGEGERRRVVELQRVAKDASEAESREKVHLLKFRLVDSTGIPLVDLSFTRPAPDRGPAALVVRVVADPTDGPVMIDRMKRFVDETAYAANPTLRRITRAAGSSPILMVAAGLVAVGATAALLGHWRDSVVLPVGLSLWWFHRKARRSCGADEVGLTICG